MSDEWKKMEVQSDLRIKEACFSQETRFWRPEPSAVAKNALPESRRVEKRLTPNRIVPEILRHDSKGSYQKHL